MAFEIPGLQITRSAGADLSAAQYTYVKINASDNVVQCAAATDVPLGILQNSPASGSEATIMVTGVSKVVADGVIALGALVGTSADGQADSKTVVTDNTEYVVGQALQAAAGAGEIIAVTVNGLNPHRAA